ncbi:MAG TPA: SDR family oxidoreductase [Terriglobales bacterium]|nr:SDR family oxidoreductase [Terriglobales bacterium]
MSAIESTGLELFDLKALTSLYDFTGQTVVLTGGTGVLAGTMALALVGCGANVALVDKNVAAGEALLDRMGEHAYRAAVVPCDVLDRVNVERVATDIRTRFGTVDHLINAAGGNDAKATTSNDLRFFDLPVDAVRWVFDLNLVGTVLPTQVFGRIMANQGFGRILNITSMSADRPLTRVPMYSAAKAGVSNFTRWLAVHMAQEYSTNIRVNAIAPGFFLTNQNRYLLTDRETGELTARGKSIIAHTPMAKFGQPEDLLGAVLWLLSPASSFVTGAVIPIDGGFSAFAGV